MYGHPCHYERVIGEAKWPTWVENFAALDDDLTVGWLRHTLKESYDEHGEVARDVLVVAGQRTIERYKRAKKAQAIVHPQGMAKHLFAVALREAREER